MNVDEFIIKVYGERPKEQRLGQWAFNLLSQIDKPLADRLRGSEADCFHDDQKVGKLFVEVCHRAAEGITAWK